MAPSNNEGSSSRTGEKRKAEHLDDDVLDLSDIKTDKEARSHHHVARKEPAVPTESSSQNSRKKGKAHAQTIDLDNVPDQAATIEVDSLPDRQPAIELDSIPDREPAIEINSDDETTSVEDVDEFSLHEFVGSVHTKIVGIQHYHGRVTTSEMVYLRREPDNAYDRNAIQVLNVRSAQVGHLPANIARALAPWLDNKVCLVEGSVKSRANVYSIPVTINIFANRRVVDQLPDALGRAGIELDARPRAPVTKGTTSVDAAGPDLDTLRAGSTTVNTREAAALLDQLVVPTKDLQKMKKARQPSRLKTKLLDYQLQGLHWMISKENPTLPQGKNSVQMWKRKASGYVNIASNFMSDTPPEFGRGGLLADDMGLGKTLQLLALLAASPEDASDVEQIADKPNESFSRATLVVCPASLMSNWEGQSQEHFRDDEILDLEVYHGKSRSSKKTLESKELVITTYGTLKSEYKALMDSKNKTAKTGLLSVRWKRVILDEAHQIRNAKSQGSLAVHKLISSRRWALSGTPVVNSYSDLGAIVRFVGWTGGLENPEGFNAQLTRKLLAPGEVVRREAVKLIQILMQDLSLRRRKDMEYSGKKLVDLPPLKEYHHKLSFDMAHERETYDKLAMQAQGLLRNGQPRSQSQVLEILLRMRQACCSVSLISEDRLKMLEKLDDMEVVEFTPENKLLLQDFLGLAIESRESCPVCMEDLGEASRTPIVTSCKHVFCRQCIVACLAEKEACPLCRASLKLSQILEMPPQINVEAQVEGKAEVDDKSSSTKIEGLLKILKATQQQDATNKTVVFSQWTKLLDLIEPKLKDAKLSYCRIDGTMSLAKRDESIRALQDQSENGASILLASLSVASVGLNLTAANSVILLDPWWSPAIEDQAVDRVYRLGQTREVSVYKLMIEGTVEEKVLAIQDNKRKMTATIGTGQTRAQQVEERRADLAALLGT